MVGQPGMAVRISFPSFPTRIVSSDFAPVMEGFHAYAWPSTDLGLAGRGCHDLARRVSRQPSLMMELPLVGESRGSIRLDTLCQDVAQFLARPRRQDEVSVHLRHARLPCGGGRQAGGRNERGESCEQTRPHMRPHNTSMA